MREKMSLRTFRKFALPALLEKHGRNEEKLRRAISNGFDIVDEADKRPVEVDVIFGDDGGDAKALDSATIADIVSKSLDENLAKLRKENPMSRNPLGITGTGSGRSIPSTIKRSPLRTFKGQDAEAKAHRWGAWALAAITGSERAKAWLDDSGLVLTKAGQLEGTNTLGGYLVPEELLNDVVDLRNEYGVFRRNAYNVVMGSDRTSRPRRTGGLTASFIGEGVAGVASTKTWDQVSLTAKKLMVLSKMSSELSDDAILNVGDDLAGEMIYAFSLKEDQCGFVGDGTAPYGGIVGVCTALTTKWPSTSTNSAGVVIASGNLFSEVTLNDLHSMVARCPTFGRRGAKWYASPAFVDGCMVKLALAVGGATLGDVVRGDTPSFLGYPVERTEVMPATDVNSQIACVFGDLSKAADFGDRRQATILFSNSGNVDGTDVWQTAEISVRATERFDLNVHDVGDGSSTAGPVVGLRMAAS